jgi:hypothetical protein
MHGYHPFTVFIGICPECQSECQVDNGVCMPHDVCGNRRNGPCSGSHSTAPQVVLKPEDLPELDQLFDVGIEVGFRYNGGKIEGYVEKLLNFMEGKMKLAPLMTWVLDFKMGLFASEYYPRNEAIL